MRKVPLSSRTLSQVHVGYSKIRVGGEVARELENIEARAQLARDEYRSPATSRGRSSWDVMASVQERERFAFRSLLVTRSFPDSDLDDREFRRVLSVALQNTLHRPKPFDLFQPILERHNGGRSRPPRAPRAPRPPAAAPTPRTFSKRRTRARVVRVGRRGFVYSNPKIQTWSTSGRSVCGFVRVSTTRSASSRESWSRARACVWSSVTEIRVVLGSRVCVCVYTWEKKRLRDRPNTLPSHLSRTHSVSRNTGAVAAFLTFSTEEGALRCPTSNDRPLIFAIPFPVLRLVETSSRGFVTIFRCCGEKATDKSHWNSQKVPNRTWKRLEFWSSRTKCKIATVCRWVVGAVCRPSRPRCRPPRGVARHPSSCGCAVAPCTSSARPSPAIWCGRI